MVARRISSSLRLLALGWCCMGISITARAGAQAAVNSAAAQGLFDQAKALMAAGKAAEACPKLEESQRLDPGSGTLLNLALCYEQTARVASAWTTYRDAAALAKASGNAERERGARERAEALAPRVAKLVIEVPAAARVPGLVVTRDGVAIGEAQWGAPIPTDEGAHALTAKAPGRQAWQSAVNVTGAGTTATTTIPPLAEASVTPVAAPLAGATTPKAPPPVPAEPQPAEPTPSGLGTQRILALAAGGVGVAGIAVGTVFGFKAMSKQNDAEATCAGTRCTTTAGADAGNDAHTAGTISTIGMVVGVAGLAGGAVLWFTAPSPATGGTRVGVGPSGVTWRGSF
jgi:serine/threonine-protein kinase